MATESKRDRVRDLARMFEGHPSADALAQRLIDEADDAGVPVPFYSIAGDVVFPGAAGTVAIDWQFAGPPGEVTRNAIIAALAAIADEPIVGESVTVSRHYDPREWRGGPVRS